MAGFWFVLFMLSLFVNIGIIIYILHYCNNWPELKDLFDEHATTVYNKLNKLNNKINKQ